MIDSKDISVVIPTYRRGAILLETIRRLKSSLHQPGEVYVIDQTEKHPPSIESELEAMNAEGRIHWHRLPFPSIPHAMNEGLRLATGRVVLFMDDDVEPSESLVRVHASRHGEGYAAVVGQVLQPGEHPDIRKYRPENTSDLTADLNFPFHSTPSCEVKNVMAGNLSVDRKAALAIGGFDEQFVGSAYRFETEFARRLNNAGFRILYEPEASLRHLRLPSGGTRGQGDHLRYPSARHSVGDYYFALRHGCGWERARYMLRRPFRECINRFYLQRPWLIPIKAWSEIVGFWQALRLNTAGPKLIGPYRLVMVETHPIQYKAPLFRMLAKDPRISLTVLYAMIPDSKAQGEGFGVSFEWDVPLLDGYRYEVLDNVSKNPSVTHFGGCDTPGIFARLKRERPDAVLVNGWVAKTCLQALWACRRLGIPCLVRGEANLLRPRAGWKHILHRLLLSRYHAYLYIGSANRAFYRFHHCPDHLLFFAPYSVDNDYFSAGASSRAEKRDERRNAWGVAPDACVFLFVGKLEEKKHPTDIVAAVARLPTQLRAKAHILWVGEGSLRPEVERLAREHTIKVTFAGFLNQSQLPDAYSAADVLVLPSDAGETWGLVVNEAMASGRPAIVSRSAGCCADLIIEGQTGFSFDVSDVDALAAIMSRYVSDPDLAGQQGKAAARHVETFCFGRIVDGMVSALKAVVGRCAERKSPS